MRISPVKMHHLLSLRLLHFQREMHCLLFPPHYRKRCVGLHLPSCPGHLSVYSTVPDIVFEHPLGLLITDIGISPRRWNRQVSCHDRHRSTRWLWNVLLGFSAFLACGTTASFACSHDVSWRFIGTSTHGNLLNSLSCSRSTWI